MDLLSRNTTWTQSREAGQGLLFTGINYFDGQGLSGAQEPRPRSAQKLNGASICAQQGTTTELNLADYFRAHGLKAETVVFSTSDEAIKAYDFGRCDAYTTDGSALYPQRLKLTQPDESVVLRDTISKEPFGPVVRQGDDRWFNLVNGRISLCSIRRSSASIRTMSRRCGSRTILRSVACSASRAITARASA